MILETLPGEGGGVRRDYFWMHKACSAGGYREVVERLLGGRQIFGLAVVVDRYTAQNV